MSTTTPAADTGGTTKPEVPRFLRVGVYQGGVTTCPRDNLEVMRAVVARAGVLSLDLVIFSELFLCGYGVKERLREFAEVQTGPSSKIVSEMAQEHNVAIAYGYSEKTEYDGRLFNSVIFIDKEGNQVANYRKTHLYGKYEKQHFSPGNILSPVFEFQGWKIAFLICYDIEFPELVRVLCMRGANLLITPSANNNPLINMTILPARAYENHTFICYCNRVGVERCPANNPPPPSTSTSTPTATAATPATQQPPEMLEFKFCGLSGILAPDGTELVRASESSNELIVTELHQNKSDYIRARNENPYLADRKPEFYRDLLKKTL
ncbi:carbon-nitrogen family hydrolase [Pelomyxa schiedti]|nr:carbon-nitrogen family hydrolase [Pelomyxa schiedti]